MAVRIADDHDELPAVERDFRYSTLALEATQLDAGSGYLEPLSIAAALEERT